MVTLKLAPLTAEPPPNNLPPPNRRRLATAQAVFFDPAALPRTDLGFDGTPWFMAPEVLSSQVFPVSGAPALPPPSLDRCPPPATNPGRRPEHAPLTA